MTGTPNRTQVITPDGVLDLTETNIDGQLLIYSIAAAGGDRDQIVAAIRLAEQKHGSSVTEVFVSALAHFGFHLAPTLAETIREHNGVDAYAQFRDAAQRQRQALAQLQLDDPQHHA